jgi:hypothetical protein
LEPTAPIYSNSALLLCNNPEDTWVTDPVSASMFFTILGSSVVNNFKAGGCPTKKSSLGLIGLEELPLLYIDDEN